MRSILPRGASIVGRVARRVAPALLTALALAVTGVWAAALIWAATRIPAPVWGAAAGFLAAYVVGLRLACDVAGTAR